MVEPRKQPTTDQNTPNSSCLQKAPSGRELQHLHPQGRTAASRHAQRGEPAAAAGLCAAPTHLRRENTEPCGWEASGDGGGCRNPGTARAGPIPETPGSGPSPPHSRTQPRPGPAPPARPPAARPAHAGPYRRTASAPRPPPPPAVPRPTRPRPLAAPARWPWPRGGGGGEAASAASRAPLGSRRGLRRGARPQRSARGGEGRSRRAGPRRGRPASEPPSLFLCLPREVGRRGNGTGRDGTPGGSGGGPEPQRHPLPPPQRRRAAGRTARMRGAGAHAPREPGERPSRGFAPRRANLRAGRRRFLLSGGKSASG